MEETKRSTSAEDADKKFEAWVEAKEAQIQAKKDGLSAEEVEARAKALLLKKKSTKSVWLPLQKQKLKPLQKKLQQQKKLQRKLPKLTLQAKNKQSCNSRIVST